MQMIAIGGAQRSGTTLLQTLLVNSLARTPLLPEAYILYDLLVAYKRAKLDWPKTSRFYAEPAELTAFYREITTLHIDDLAKRYAGSDFLVLKNPNYVQVLAELVELFPDVKIVAAVRDPRDIVASFLKIGDRERSRGIESNYTRRNFNFMCRKINETYDALFAYDGSGNVTLVRYERLVADPAATLEDLGAELGLDVDLQRLHAPAWLEDEFRHKATWITSLEGRGPVPTSVGDFKKHLHENELVKVETLCRPLMARLGYVPISPEATELPNVTHGA